MLFLTSASHSEDKIMRPHIFVGNQFKKNTPAVGRNPTGRGGNQLKLVWWSLRELSSYCL